MAKKYDLLIGPARIPVTIFREGPDILMGCQEDLDRISQPLCVDIEDAKNKARLASIGKSKPNGNGFTYLYRMEVISGSVIF
ncbi:MAG: hypothetical protein ABIA11_02225 [Patescibacteria group bacterium]